MCALVYYVKAVYCFECPSHLVLSSHISTCHRWCPRASIHAMSVRPSRYFSNSEVVRFKHGLCPAIVTNTFIDIFIIYNIIRVPFMLHILCKSFTYVFLFNPMTNLQARFNYSFHFMQGKIETPDITFSVYSFHLFPKCKLQDWKVICLFLSLIYHNCLE